jgi:hypothetical protein
LTYARRYALFTMVGIAGEDDLDAPPDVPNDAKAADIDSAAGPGPAPVRPSQSQTGNGTDPQTLARLSAEESAAIGAQLIREIETLPQGELQPRAIAILKAKNRLSADDAKQVEDVFAARIVLQEPLPKNGPMAALSGQSQSQPTAPLTGPAKPQRKNGRSRKSRPRTSNPAHPRPSQSRPTTNSRRLQHTFTTTRPGRSTKVYLRLASPVAFAARPTSGSSPHSPVWSVEEAPPTPTICGSPSPARWDSRSAMSSPYLCAESITATAIAPETKLPGGRDGLLTPSRHRGCSRFRRAVSNDSRSHSGGAYRTTEHVL